MWISRLVIETHVFTNDTVLVMTDNVFGLVSNSMKLKCMLV